MDNNFYKETADQVLRGVEYLLDQNNQKSTQIYSGVITSDGTILINGRKYNIPQYGTFTHNTNDVVKVFVPQGNMSVAFYI